jgi:hypothetical protein
MRSIRLGLIGSAIVTVVVMAGCTDAHNSAGDSARPSGSTAATSGQSTSTSAAPSGTPAVDADTRTACTLIKGDIDAAMANVATAEKIGPPAGHDAVSAQYSAGAAALYAHMFGASTGVSDAAKQVAKAMSDLADAYAKAPATPPSKAALDAAVKQFTDACGSYL